MYHLVKRTALSLLSALLWRGWLASAVCVWQGGGQDQERCDSSEASEVLSMLQRDTPSKGFSANHHSRHRTGHAPVGSRGAGSEESRCILRVHGSTCGYSVLPSCTGGGANLTDFHPPWEEEPMRHRVFLPTGEGPGLLWVVLPGSYDLTADSSQLVGSWPEVHRIVLSYDNLAAVEKEYCLVPKNVASLVDYITSDVNETNSECFWAVRYQMVMGEVWRSANPDPEVRRAIDGIRIGSPFKLGVDGIENRLLKLLTYLRQEQPDAGWSAFLDAGNVNWKRVVLAGHSQGGGHAVVMSMLHAVHRVVQLSSVCDVSSWTDGRYCRGGSPARASCQGVRPPAEGYYGVIQHGEVDICNKSVAEYHWRQLSKESYSLGGVSEAIKEGFRYIDSSYLPNSLCTRALAAMRERRCNASSTEERIYCDADFPLHLSTATDLCVPRHKCYAKGIWPYLLGRASSRWWLEWELASSVLGQCKPPA